MPVQADWIRFGDHAAYLARPQGSPGRSRPWW